jgi:hypothetical protein
VDSEEMELSEDSLLELESLLSEDSLLGLESLLSEDPLPELPLQPA